MTPPSESRFVVLMVWTLISLGVVACAVTIGLADWTLSNLHEQRLRLNEKEKLLIGEEVKLRRLTQRARGEMSRLLPDDASPPGEQDSPERLRALTEVLRGVGQEPGTGTPGSREVRGILDRMASLLDATAEWRQRYAARSRDVEPRRRADEILHALRASVEILEGRQRLQEAIRIRRWRIAEPAHRGSLAQSILDDQTARWRQVLTEVRTELGDLAVLVQNLASEEHIDALVDIKDNQLKPSLERLARNVAVLADEAVATDKLSPVAVSDLRDALFGAGHFIDEAHQTIRLGEGGLYRLRRDILQLRKERQAMRAAWDNHSRRLETIFPKISNLTRQQAVDFARQAEANLERSLVNLLVMGGFFIVLFLAIGWKISANVRSQVSTLAQLRRNNALILSCAGEGIIGLDLAGAVRFANPAGAAMLGWEAGELIGQRLQATFCPDAAGAGFDNPRTPAIEVPAQRREGEFRRKDGTMFPVEFVSTAMRGEQQSSEGQVIAFVDITGRKQAEEKIRRYYDQLEKRDQELRELNRNLEEKVANRTRLLEQKSLELIHAREVLNRTERLAAVGTLAARVAHEINNPAAIIRGNAEILLGELHEGADGWDEGREILKQTDRIAHIVEDMLSSARDHTVELEHVDVNELLREILAQLAHQVSMNDVMVKRSLGEDVHMLIGDGERLRQVFTNIILNGIQAMDGRGSLTVFTAQDKDTVVVRIADTGPGVPEDVREQIFNPFITTKPRGVGLGLAIAYGVVRAHGGVIQVHDNKPSGAVFTMRLPTRTAAADLGRVRTRTRGEDRAIT